MQLIYPIETCLSSSRLFLTLYFVFDMIDAVYHAKSLIFIGATFREKYISHHRDHRAVNVNC